MVIKIPNYTNKEILEIIKKINMGVKYIVVKSSYDISYYDIKRICGMFKDCMFEEDCDRIRDRIKEQNEIDVNVGRDYKRNYVVYKEYYTDYNRLRQASLLITNPDTPDDKRHTAKELIIVLRKRINDDKKERRIERAERKQRKLAILGRSVPNPVPNPPTQIECA